MVTLTERGPRLARKASGLPEGQRIYHGIVKPRERDHDADLYKVYQKAVEQIQEKGGKPLRVRVYFGLKGAMHRDEEAAEHIPEEIGSRGLVAVHAKTGSRIDGTAHS